jgi:hypothetical protein
MIGRTMPRFQILESSAPVTAEAQRNRRENKVKTSY